MTSRALRTWSSPGESRFPMSDEPPEEVDDQREKHHREKQDKDEGTCRGPSKPAGAVVKAERRGAIDAFRMRPAAALGAEERGLDRVTEKFDLPETVTGLTVTTNAPSVSLDDLLRVRGPGLAGGSDLHPLPPGFRMRHLNTGPRRRFSRRKPLVLAHFYRSC